jgi:hypothetical protein
MLTELFEQFVRERKYLKNVTPKTVIYYQKPVYRTIRKRHYSDFRYSTKSFFSCSVKLNFLKPL